MKRASLFAVTLLLAPYAFAQIRGANPEEQPRFLFYEATNLIAQDSTKSRVDIHYRIDQQFFVQVKNPDSSFPWKFRRRGEVLVELDDSTGVSRARSIDEVIIGGAEADESPEPKQWQQGLISFSVPPGRYTIVMEVTDLESDRNYLDQSRTIRAMDFRSAGLESATPLFVSDSGSTTPPSTLVLQNFGGDLLFGSSESLLLEFPSRELPDSTASVEYEFAEAHPSSDDARQKHGASIPSLRVFHAIELSAEKTENSARYRLINAEQSPAACIIVPLQTQTLPLRNYTLSLTIRQGQRVRHISRPVRMLWPDMPRSLRDVEYAIDALRYIASEGKRDSLKQGDFEERRDNLEAFWKSRDPNPETAFNKVMTQYYRRVDYASRHFGTMHDPDGSRTDRGRIYILLGPPASTERTLDPAAGFKEVWVYEHPQRSFTFLDSSKSGNYVLVTPGP